MKNGDWKSVLGYEGLYSINRACQLRSDRRSKILKPRPNWDGYVRYCLQSDGHIYYPMAHRLLWEAFNGLIPDGLQINHINGLKGDNRIENLEVVSHQENRIHGLKVLNCRRSPNGERHWNSKLTAEAVTEIRAMAKSGISHPAIARKFEVSRSLVTQVTLRMIWGHVP